MKKKAFVVCHMMASVDGRIDCDMTEQIGSDGYYKALAALNGGGQGDSSEALCRKATVCGGE